MSTIADQGNLIYSGHPYKTPQSQSIQNVQWSQLGWAGSNNYNRITKEPFYSPRSTVSIQDFNNSEALKQQLPVFKAAPYHSKAYNDAIEALKAADDYRAKQHFHDMLNKNNLTGKTDWTATIPTQTDGSDTLYHQPAHVRIMNSDRSTFEAGTRTVPVFNENGKTTLMNEPRPAVRIPTDMFGNFAHGVLEPLDANVEVPAASRMMSKEVASGQPEFYKSESSQVSPDAFMSGSPQEQQVPDFPSPSTPSYSPLPSPKIQIQRAIPVSGRRIQQDVESNLVEMSPATVAVSINPIFKKTLGKRNRAASDVGFGRTKSQNVRDGLTYTNVNAAPSNTASVTAQTTSTQAVSIHPVANARLTNSHHVVGNAYMQKRTTPLKIEPIFARNLGKRSRDVNDVGVGRTQSAYTGRKTAVSRINTNRPLDLPLENISSGSGGFPSNIKLSAVTPSSSGYNPFGFHTSPISS